MTIGMMPSTLSKPRVVSRLFDFENSYLWATSSLLGGLKKSKIIIEKLNNYLSEDQIESIKEKVRSFLEKRALKKDKRAIIQIAKFYEQLIDPPDMINSYTWYNIGVASGIKSAKNKRDEDSLKINQKNTHMLHKSKVHILRVRFKKRK